MHLWLGFELSLFMISILPRGIEVKKMIFIWLKLSLRLSLVKFFVTKKFRNKKVYIKLALKAYQITFLQLLSKRMNSFLITFIFHFVTRQMKVMDHTLPQAFLVLHVTCYITMSNKLRNHTFFGHPVLSAHI